MEAALAPVGSRHAQPVNHGTSLSDPAATLATACFHKVEHLCERLLDGSDALLAQTCSAFRRHAARRPTKVGPRDREAARGPDLGVGMGAGVIPNAYMVKELSDSTPDERHLDLRRLRKASEEVKRQ